MKKLNTEEANSEKGTQKDIMTSTKVWYWKKGTNRTRKIKRMIGELNEIQNKEMRFRIKNENTLKPIIQKKEMRRVNKDDEFSFYLKEW